MTRDEMAKKLGRRVSLGEYQRKTTKYIYLAPPYMGMITLDPKCPKAKRKAQT